MKTKILPIITALFIGACASALAFGPYTNPYDGTATIKTGKKTGQLAASATAGTTDGSDASVIVAGQGSRGISVNAVLKLESNGKASLTLTAKVLADRKLLKKGEDMPRGQKVVVRLKAKGDYTVNGDTATFVVSGNAGKGGGTNVTGTFTTDLLGNMSLQFSSGFKQKLSGVGKKLQFSFAGMAAMP